MWFMVENHILDFAFAGLKNLSTLGDSSLELALRPILLSPFGSVLGFSIKVKAMQAKGCWDCLWYYGCNRALTHQGAAVSQTSCPAQLKVLNGY